MTDWNPKLTGVLEKIRLNSIFLSEKHRHRYLESKALLKYFDLPVIVCSVFSSSFIGLKTVPAHRAQLVTTAISMFIAILTSIKLYLNLQNLITEEVALSKDFYILSVEIYKVLSLQESDRGVSPNQFLNDCYSRYVKMIEISTLLKINIRKDELVKIDVNYGGSDTSSINSENILITDQNEV